MLNKLSCIIFDFDGVIADTDRGRFELLKNILSYHGIDLEKESQLSEIQGLTTEAFLKHKFPKLDDHTVSTIIEERRNSYLSNLEKYCLPNDGYFETIDYLHNKGYLLALATTNELLVLRKILNHLRIEKYFSRLFTKENLLKDSRELKDYGFVLNEIGKNKTECLVIEDSLVGVTAAKMAGLKCLAFGKKLDPKTVELADLKSSSFSDLLGKFKNGLTI